MRALSLAFALSLSLVACDTDGVDTEGSFPARSFVELSPRATYLLSVGDGNVLPAGAISLAAIGLHVGDTACFTAAGDYFVSPGVLASAGPVMLTAVFSRSAELLVPSERFRVSGAIEAGEDVITPPTYIDARATDIVQDFDASDVCVRVPAATTHVFFSTFDDFHGDNLDARTGGQPFGVRIRRG